jgi:hypothetical protein
MALSEEGFRGVRAHEGRQVGMKLLVELPPDEARRLTQLADEKGTSLTGCVRRLVNDAAARDR